MSSQVMVQEKRDLAHGDGEDEEPTETRDEEERRSDETPEDCKEDDSSDSPLSTAEQS